MSKKKVNAPVPITFCAQLEVGVDVGLIDDFVSSEVGVDTIILLGDIFRSSQAIDFGFLSVLVDSEAGKEEITLIFSINYFRNDFKLMNRF